MLHEFHKNFPAQEETCKCMVRENYLEIIISAVSRGDREGEENQPLWVGKGRGFHGAWLHFRRARVVGVCV